MFQEKDIHSGLIGPILICQKGTFSKSYNSGTLTRDFFLLFMVFDEEKSWYFDKRSRRPCTEKTQEMQQCHKFHGTYFLLPSIQFIWVQEKILGGISADCAFEHAQILRVNYVPVFFLFSIVPIIIIVLYANISSDWKFVIKMKKAFIRLKLSTESFSLTLTYIYIYISIFKTKPKQTKKYQIPPKHKQIKTPHILFSVRS